MSLPALLARVRRLFQASGRVKELEAGVSALFEASSAEHTSTELEEAKE